MARQQIRILAAALLGVATWNLAVKPAFCGAPLATPRQTSVDQNGWRLDRIEVGAGGIGQLVTAEGYFIGEQAMYDIMSKNGRRYRMRATSEETKNGLDAPPITQIGPLKLRLYETFGGSSRKPGLVRPEGYRGIAGSAAFFTDVPKKGGWALQQKE
eukprot:TRINITY_DN6482_c0_g1_i1.p1 TRINITY_DN6482_c0_g1~~TRINITY_DN6482_c0_g1_i1.p1  ORF type:complete len:157 (+),score=40.07 TRINITY_DN6482_c0_g1_i1:118-588(+)